LIHVSGVGTKWWFWVWLLPICWLLVIITSSASLDVLRRFLKFLKLSLTLGSPGFLFK
jgi:hypothetical protein